MNSFKSTTLIVLEDTYYYNTIQNTEFQESGNYLPSSMRRKPANSPWKVRTTLCLWQSLNVTITSHIFEHGIRQGNPLSPSLFIIWIEPLLKCLCVVERFELFVPFNFIRCLRCDKLLKKPVQEMQETKLLDGIFMPVFDDNQLNEIIGPLPEVAEGVPILLIFFFESWKIQNGGVVQTEKSWFWLIPKTNS